MPEPTTAGVGLPFPREDKYATAEQAVVRQLRSGRLSDTARGPAIQALEEAFADLTDTRFALALNSGTSALHTAAIAAGIPLRPLYDDWVRSPLFQQPDLLQRLWPHIRLTPYTPPTPTRCRTTTAPAARR